MSETKIVEIKEVIATRVPPGDRWVLTSEPSGKVYPSIMEMLEAFFITTKFKGDYRFSPMEGKVYILKTTEEVVVPPPPKQFNIYGEPA